MAIISGRILFLQYKIKKSIKLSIKNIATSLFDELSFYLNHLRSVVSCAYTKPYYLINCTGKNKKPHECGVF